ncbi:MAG: hypothetical protein V3G42_13830 [Oscillospiraceae bacterium]
MNHTTTPYLCGGTFMTQILRFVDEQFSPNEHLQEKKDIFPECEIFRRLISVFQLREFQKDSQKSRKPKSTLRTYASEFKNCKNSLGTFTKLNDFDMRKEFDKNVRRLNGKALEMMNEFIQDALSEAEDENKYKKLVRSLLGIIMNDDEISQEDLFYINGDETAVAKKELPTISVFYIAPFLLGVWHYIVMKRFDKNELGQATYKEWYPTKDTYKGTVGCDIADAFQVLNLLPSDTTDSSDETVPLEGAVIDEETVKNHQFATSHTIVNQTGTNNVYAEYIGTLNL